MPEVLIVCTANICRSPMAQALLADRLQRADPGMDWRVTSAGVWASAGDLASEGGRAAMALRDLDLRDHRSQPVTGMLLERADLILVMANDHREALLADFPGLEGRVYLLSEMAGKSYDVADPYGGPMEGYERTAAELEALIDQGLDRIMALAD